jgi:hypothetical protein
LLVLLRWAASFLTHGRGARLIGAWSPPEERVHRARDAA